MKPVLLLAALVALAAGPARAETIVIGDRTMDARGVRSVRMHFSVGRLIVVGTDSREVTLHADAKCGSFTWHCDDRVRDMTLSAERHGDVLELALENQPTENGPKVTARIEVPRDLALDLRVEVGQVEVHDVESDVDVEMGVGQIDVEMPQSAVGRGHVDVGVGGASIRRKGGQVTSEGGNFLGRELAWDDGPGDARVRVKVGVGDADIRLR